MNRSVTSNSIEKFARKCTPLYGKTTNKDLRIKGFIHFVQIICSTGFTPINNGNRIPWTRTPSRTARLQLWYLFKYCSIFTITEAGNTCHPTFKEDGHHQWHTVNEMYIAILKKENVKLDHEIQNLKLKKKEITLRIMELKSR